MTLKVTLSGPDGDAGQSGEAGQSRLTPHEARLSSDVEQCLASLALLIPGEGEEDQEILLEETQFDGGDDRATERPSLEHLQQMVARATEARPSSSTAEEAVNSTIHGSGMRMPPALTLPWEMGFAAMVMGPTTPWDALMSSYEAPAEENLTKVNTETKMQEAEDDESDHGFARAFVGRDRVRMSMEDEAKQEREKEIERWMVVIHALGDESPMGKMIDEEGGRVVYDIFAKKKTGTLKTRCVAMMLYIRWAQSKNLSPFPLTVATVYSYVDELRKNRAPATRASSFRSALAFIKGTLNVKGVDAILDNSAISGSCHRSYVTKRVLKQRDALTTDQVMTLETVVEHGQTLAEKVFAGLCLMCTYGRLRFGDSQGIESEPVIDGEYLEAGTSMHKTDSMVGRTRRLLPVAAPAVGITKGCWAAEFLKARKAAGLRAGVGRAFMPVPLIGGGWSPGRLRTTEASIWLCELLQKYSLSVAPLENVGSHSMKATTLSWLAKAGVPEKVRRLLGYHIKPKDKSLIIYSRDALAGPLETLRDLTLKIAMGEFSPDVTRSGRWRSKPVEINDVETIYEDSEEEGDEVLEAEQSGCDDMDVDERAGETAEHSEQSSDSVEETEDESEEGEMERVVEKVVVGMVGPAKRRGVGQYRNGLTGKIHLAGVVEGKLACGRPITATMVRLEEEVHGLGSMCKVCTGYSK